MAKALSKSQLVAAIAEKATLSKKQAAEILDHLAAARLQAREGHLHAARHRQARPQEPRRPHGPQPQDRGSHPDQGQARREVPRRQGREGRDPRCQVIFPFPTGASIRRSAFFIFRASRSNHCRGAGKRPPEFPRKVVRPVSTPRRAAFSGSPQSTGSTPRLPPLDRCSGPR